MKRFRCGIDRYGAGGYGALRCRLTRQWYDGPFWELEIGPFWAVWNIHGLPRIFQGG